MTDPPPSTANVRGRATIEDVASAAGVSVATVSRALRGLPNVAASTRERVCRIAAELSYRADPAASRLATGRSQAVAVAVPLLNGWYFSHVVAGVEAVCAEAGYDTVVVGVGGTASDRDRFDGSEAIHRRVDGLIVVDIDLRDTELAALDRQGVRVVQVGAATDHHPSVGIDDVAVGQIAAEHLIDLGHRRIGVIHDPTDEPYGYVVAQQRQLGFERGCRAAGIAPDPALFSSGAFTIQGGYDALGALLALADPPTAVFAMSDEMAFGALQYAREHGVSVPRDLSVIGVDDHDAAPVVGLTTVHQDVADHGARAGRLMLELLAGGGDPDRAAVRINAPVRLVVRETTAPAAGASSPG